MSGVLEKLEKYKYLLLMLLLGLILILLPTGSKDSGQTVNSSTATEAEARLESVLGTIEGVGRIGVLYSEDGVVVVCSGAESARVRLDVVNAVTAYTGYGSDRVTVLKMKQTD